MSGLDSLSPGNQPPSPSETGVRPLVSHWKGKTAKQMKERRRWEIKRKDRAFQGSIPENARCLIGRECIGTLIRHHVKSRRYLKTRFDMSNTWILCVKHHSELHTMGEKRSRAHYNITKPPPLSDLLPTPLPMTHSKQHHRAKPHDLETYLAPGKSSLQGVSLQQLGNDLFVAHPEYPLRRVVPQSDGTCLLEVVQPPDSASSKRSPSTEETPNKISEFHSQA